MTVQQLQAKIDWSEVEALEARAIHVSALQRHQDGSFLLCLGQVTPPIAVTTDEDLKEWLSQHGGRIAVHHGLVLSMSPPVARAVADLLTDGLEEEKET